MESLIDDISSPYTNDEQLWLDRLQHLVTFDGYNIDYESVEFGITFLQKACSREYYELVYGAIKLGADVNRGCHWDHNSNALDRVFQASSKEQSEKMTETRLKIITLLLDSGVRVREINFYGYCQYYRDARLFGRMYNRAFDTINPYHRQPDWELMWNNVLGLTNNQLIIKRLISEVGVHRNLFRSDVMCRCAEPMYFGMLTKAGFRFDVYVSGEAYSLGYVASSKHWSFDRAVRNIYEMLRYHPAANKDFIIYQRQDIYTFKLNPRWMQVFLYIYDRIQLVFIFSSVDIIPRLGRRSTLPKSSLHGWFTRALDKILYNENELDRDAYTSKGH